MTESARPPSSAAPELVEAGFAVEVADAPLLHHGLNLADLAHLTVLHERGLVPDASASALCELLVAVHASPAESFPYDPAYGESYNARERYFSERLGSAAGWLHAGRPRREAVRLALRLRLRRDVAELVRAAADLVSALAEQSERHAETRFADQTYLQQAQPSTFGHYLLSFAYPVARDAERLVQALDWVNRSPGGAGCVNGSRLLHDRQRLADLLGFDGVITHTRDAMWQVDGLVDLVSSAASLVTTESKLAEDLEIYSSQEFDFVELADHHSRGSVLMPQKRNPYALSVLRGHAGVMIGKVTELFALMKSPSARSDNLIFAYGEVPRAVEAGRRATRLLAGVVADLSVNAEHMREALDSGFSQATDLAEHLMEHAGIDYRSAYLVAGEAVHKAAAKGLRGVDVSAELVDDAAREVLGHPVAMSDAALRLALDPANVVASRTGQGGAAPAEVRRMAAECRDQARRLHADIADRTQRYDDAEEGLLATARELAQRQTVSDQPPSEGGRTPREDG